jgi:hypothetical protein
MEHDTAMNTTLQALWLSMEQACARYLTARKAMVALAGRAASLQQLVAEHPTRRDYRYALTAALAARADAIQRTDTARKGWSEAQLRYDDAWTATEGRHPQRLTARTAA